MAEVHVRPNPEPIGKYDRWIVVEEPRGTAVADSPTQRQAIGAARSHTRRQGGVLVIHRPDGTVRAKRPVQAEPERKAAAIDKPEEDSQPDAVPLEAAASAPGDTAQYREAGIEEAVRLLNARAEALESGALDKYHGIPPWALRRIVQDIRFSLLRQAERDRRRNPNADPIPSA